MGQPAVQIVTREEFDSLRGQLICDSWPTLPSGRVLAFVADQDRTEAVLGLEIDDGGIALLGPLWTTLDVAAEIRKSIWHAALEWSRLNGAQAVQIVCNKRDVDTLKELGLLQTTEIVQLTRSPGTEFEKQKHPDVADPDIQTGLGPGTQEAESLIQQISKDSLDVPESQPYRSAASIFESSNRASTQLVLTARSHGRIVGIAVTSRCSESAEIRYLGVHPEFRGQGWGCRLLTDALGSINSSQHLTVTTCVDARNIPALRLFQKHGFAVQFTMPLIFLPLGDPAARDTDTTSRSNRP